MNQDQSYYKKPEGIKETVSAGGLVIRKQDDQILIALIQDKGTRHTGYSLPKGHVEPGETLEQAATREITEETGISDLHLIKKLDTEERLQFDKSEWKTIHYFLFTTNQKTGIPTDPEHTTEVEWFDVHNLPEIFWPEQRKLIQDNIAIITSIR